MFLWQDDVGGGLARDSASLDKPPAGVDFACYRHDRHDVTICIGHEVATPHEIIVRPRRWPFRGVRVYVDGKRWGWRGEHVGGGV